VHGLEDEPGRSDGVGGQGEGDELGAEHVVAEYERLAIARRDAGRSVPSWLSL
jgi:hypothetical protein